MSTTSPSSRSHRGLPLHLLLCLLSIAMIAPFVWMVMTSLKTLPEVAQDHWVPRDWQWANYAEVFEVIPFTRFIWNSVFVAGWVTFLQVLTSAMAAFSFSRLQWPHRDRVFFLYLGTMMLPGLVMLIPNYQLMVHFGLVDSFLGLILPAAFSAFGTFLLRQFMLTIPSSLDEAAAIDGATPWQVFWHVILPLSLKNMDGLTIVMMKSVEKYTLPVGLLFFDSSYGQATNLLMAAVTMSVVPLIIVFALLQRHLISGIQVGAVKG